MTICCLKPRPSDTTAELICHINRSLEKDKTTPFEIDEGLASAGREVLINNREKERVWGCISCIAFITAAFITTVALASIVAIAALSLPLYAITATLIGEAVGIVALVVYFVTSLKAPRKLQDALNQPTQAATIHKLSLGAEIFEQFTISTSNRRAIIENPRDSSRICSAAHWLAGAGKVKALAYCLIVVKPEKRADFASVVLHNNKRDIKSARVISLLKQFGARPLDREG